MYFQVTIGKIVWDTQEKCSHMLHTYTYHNYENSASMFYISLMFTQRGYLQQMRFQSGFNSHFKLKFDVFSILKMLE